MNVISSSNKAEPYISGETFDGVSCYAATLEDLLSFVLMPVGTLTNLEENQENQNQNQASEKQISQAHF